MTAAITTAARSARLVAFYLPQFHPIPENDEWWGRGFTEWHNVAKAKPMFRGHDQPRVPADLGFYDLRVPDVREAQAAMARAHGIAGFCYYHYWFAGRRILERPFNEVLASGAPDFPFCVCWANDTWSGRWHGLDDKVLIEQTYPGEDDDRRHFAALLPAFIDRRYIRIDDRPVFMIYRPRQIPHLGNFVALWQQLAMRAGLRGIWFVAYDNPEGREMESFRTRFGGFTAPELPPYIDWVSYRHPIAWLRWKYSRVRGYPDIFDHRSVAASMLPDIQLDGIDHYPCVVPNWDNTPRSGKRGRVLTHSTPGLFKRELTRAIDMVQRLPTERRLVFIKSWNEWAEGNYLEPDLQDGDAYLRAARDALAPP